MSQMRAMALVALLVTIIAGSVTTADATGERSSATRGSAGDQAQAAPSSSSRARALHRIARRHDADSTVGPARAHGRVFGGYSVVRSVYCCRDPHNKLRLLRWHGGRWTTDGLLSAVEESFGNDHYWNFPDYGLYLRHIRRASREAPVIGGPVNGTYPSAHMLAVRSNGQWRWASFIECRRLAGCDRPTERGQTILNPVVSNGRLTSRVSSCKPSCGAPHQVMHVIRFAWRPDRSAFVEVAVHRTHS